MERLERGTPIRPLIFAVFVLLAVPTLAPYLGAPAQADGASVDATGPEEGADAPAGPSFETQKTTALDALRSLDGYFIENRGQVAAPVRFYAVGDPSVGFRDDGVMFVLRGASARGADAREAAGTPRASFLSGHAAPSPHAAFAYLVRFDGAQNVTPRGRGELTFASNFLIGNDPGRWNTGVPNYREIVYEGLYPGIDLSFRRAGARVKYEFDLRPGADPAEIRMRYEGVDDLRLDDAGIAAITPLGEVRDSPPVSYQGGGEAVDCRFAARGAGSYGFACEGRDTSKPLTIDPLVYSTFLGGSDDAFFGYQRNQQTGEWEPVTCGQGDRGVSIDVDGAGNAYVLGSTCSTNFPVTSGAFNTTYWEYWDPTWQQYFTGDPQQLFIAKLNPSGSAPVYSTFLAGRGYQFGWSLAVDEGGSAYLAGETNSTDFPTTPGAFDRTFNSYYGPLLDFPDVFIAKLNPTGSDLAYSTFVGGGGWDWPYALAVDSAGNAYVTGDTNSADFPTTPGSYRAAFRPPMDTFVVKLNATGRTLAYSTFLGGSGWENAFGVTVDRAGYAFVTGQTNSTDFPTTPGALRQVLMGRADASVTKLDPSGAALVYSTFLGGTTPNDCGTSVAVDSLGHAYVTGYTYSVDFPLTPDAFDTHLDLVEGFITELNASGNGLVYSTYIGGSGADDQGSSIKVDALGIAYITGWTNSSDFPTTADAFDRTLDGKGDAFVVKLVPVTVRHPPALPLTPADITLNPLPPPRIGTP